LFHKAIVQSGGGRAGILGERAVTGAGDSGKARGLVFAKQYGIAGHDAEALKKLRAVPVATIAKGFNMMTMNDPSHAGGPLLDGKLFVGAPSTAYAQGQGARVPLIIGANDMDIGFTPATHDPGPEGHAATERANEAPKRSRHE
jgi:para-nitrobenzyl esterase